MTLEPQTLIDDEHLRARWLPGASRVHIVSFAGIGHGLGAIQLDEFRRSLAAAEPSACSFVVDKDRRWYNGLENRILSGIADAARVAPAKRFVTLGNSMGGFGAAYFAAQIPGCDTAICFAPQFSINPAVCPSQDRRWAGYREAVSTHTIRHAMDKVSPGVRYHLFFGLADALDLKHAELFEAAATNRCSLYFIHGAEHDVTTRIKQRGTLAPLIDLLVSAPDVSRETVIDLLARGGLTVSTKRLCDANAR